MCKWEWDEGHVQVALNGFLLLVLHIGGVVSAYYLVVACVGLAFERSSGYW